MWFLYFVVQPELKGKYDPRPTKLWLLPSLGLELQRLIMMHGVSSGYFPECWQNWSKYFGPESFQAELIKKFKFGYIMSNVIVPEIC